MDLEFFQGKSVIVTGAGRGIGRAIAVKLYQLGSTVYAVSKSPDTLASLKSECPNVITVQVDLGDWNATRAALEPLPVADCLVNNAGVCKAAKFQDTSREYLDLLFNINFKGVVNASQIFVKKLVAAGKKGSIVNVSSSVSIQPNPMAFAYSSLKAGLDHLTRNMAVELAPLHIRVNSVNPGAVETDMLLNFVEEGKKYGGQTALSILDRIPCPKKDVDVQDVANITLFLLSDAAKAMIGTIVPVDGGFIIG